MTFCGVALKNLRQSNIRLTLFVSSFVIASSAAVAGEIVGTKSKGKWVAGTSAQVNIKCLQAWICKVPSVMHGPTTKVVSTPNDKSWGVCNAAGGDIEGCNACSATPPSQPCEYWLEKK